MGFLPLPGPPHPIARTRLSPSPTRDVPAEDDDAASADSHSEEAAADAPAEGRKGSKPASGPKAKASHAVNGGQQAAMSLRLRTGQLSEGGPPSRTCNMWWVPHPSMLSSEETEGEPCDVCMFWPWCQDQGRDTGDQYCPGVA